MLVLSRKKNEVIQIGSDITVKVIGISRGRVRIAIDAPEHVRVLRGEISAETPSLQVAGGASYNVVAMDRLDYT